MNVRALRDYLPPNRCYWIPSFFQHIIAPSVSPVSSVYDHHLEWWLSEAQLQPQQPYSPCNWVCCTPHGYGTYYTFCGYRTCYVFYGYGAITIGCTPYGGMVPSIILPTMQPPMAVWSSTGSSSGSCRGHRSQHQWTPPVPPPVVINTTEEWWHMPPLAVHSPLGPVVAMPGHHSPSRCCESLTRQHLSCDGLQIIYSQPTAPYPPPTLFPQQPIMPVPIAGMGFPPIWKIFPTFYYKSLCFLPTVTQPLPILISPSFGLI